MERDGEDKSSTAEVPGSRSGTVKQRFRNNCVRALAAHCISTACGVFIQWKTLPPVLRFPTAGFPTFPLKTLLARDLLMPGGCVSPCASGQESDLHAVLSPRVRRFGGQSQIVNPA